MGAASDLDGPEGIVRPKVEGGKGDEETCARSGSRGEVVNDVGRPVGVAEGLPEAEVRAVVEVDEVCAGELAGRVFEEEGDAKVGHFRAWARWRVAGSRWWVAGCGTGLAGAGQRGTGASGRASIRGPEMEEY